MRLTITALTLFASLPAVAAPLSYNRDVRPILALNLLQSLVGQSINAFYMSGSTW